MHTGVGVTAAARHMGRYKGYGIKGGACAPTRAERIGCAGPYPRHEVGRAIMPPGSNPGWPTSPETGVSPSRGITSALSGDVRGSSMSGMISGRVPP